MTRVRPGSVLYKKFGYFLAGSLLAHAVFVSSIFLYPIIRPNEMISSIVINLNMPGGRAAPARQAGQERPHVVVVHRREGRMILPEGHAVRKQASERATTQTTGNVLTAVATEGPGGHGPGMGAGQGIVSSNELDSQPALVEFKNPVYPIEARRKGTEGVVVLKALIGPDGRVKEVKLLRPVPIFDESAVDAVRQWRFTPITSHGNPVYVWMIIPIRFTLR